MRERPLGLSSRNYGALGLLVVLTASLLVALPVGAASAVTVAEESATVAAPQPSYGPGRLKNATPMTQGCIVSSTRVVKHLKGKKKACAPGSRKVEFKVTLPTQLCLMPGGPLKSFRDRAACERADGIPTRGLGNNKMLFCAVPGKAVRWVSRSKRCVRPERRYTLRNHRPISLTLGGGKVDENAGRSAVVGTLQTVDLDPGDVHRYALVAGAGSQDNGLFRIADGQLLARADLDHEAAETRRVRVRVRDFRFGRRIATFVIAVDDVNEAPTGLALDGSTVTENSPAGTEVGVLAASDVDADDVQSYALVGAGNDNDDFEVRGDRLVTAAELDHEAGTTRTVRVRVTDAGGLSEEKEFVVDVTDVNEAPTALALSRDVVVENAPARTLVGLIEVADVDAGAPYSFEVVAGSGDGDLFVADGDRLLTTRPLDHEAQSVRTIQVKVTDVDGLVFTETLRVRVADLNEAPTALALDGDEVVENAPAGTVVGGLSGTDADSDDTLTYALATGAGDADNGLFEVVGERLRTKVALDHEESATRSVRLRTVDAAGLTFERTFAIAVRDVNETPTGLRISRDAIDENAALGSVVGVLAADDQDARDTLTFALVRGAGDADNDFFEVVGAELRTRRALDHEASATRNVLVRVTDAAGEPQERSFTITVRDLNEGPRDLALDHDEVEENAAAGTVVGQLSASDEDDADSLTFALVAGAGDTDNNLFEVVGDELRTRRALDHEAAATRSVRLRVSDGTGEQYARAFTITVLDLNEAPDAPTLGDDRVRENAPAGTVVGRLRGIDPDAGATLTFGLAAGTGDTDNDDFEVVGDELRTTRAFDFEAEPTRSIRVRVSDGDLTASSTLTVRVVDVDEAPTGLALDHDEIDENLLGRVGSLSASDAEGDTLTYALTTGTGDTDNAAFVVDGDELRTKATLDFEAGATRSVRIQVTDGTSTVARSFTVTVLDVNEAPFELALAGGAIDENAVAPVGTLSASDVDAGDVLTYALVTGDGDGDNADFEVVGGELRTKVGLDFETRATRTLRVAVRDRAGLTVAKKLTVTVRDVNEVPTLLTLSDDEVVENAADAEVGALSATDPDAGTVLRWSLVAGAGDTDNGDFAVAHGKLRTLIALDHEARATRSVRVQVSDGSLTAEQEFTVTVTDVNDAPTGLTLAPGAVAENAADALVGDLAADDQDGDTLTYALVAGDGDTHNAAFVVRGAELRTVDGLDFEAGATRSVRVRASDGREHVERRLSVRVTDVNESPSDLALSSRLVDENALDAVVGALSASDPDAGSTLRFALVAGAGDTHNGQFRVSGTTLRTDGALDFESGATRRVRIAVTDGELTVTEAFTITVRDRNDAPTAVAMDPSRIRLDAEIGDVVGTLSATDADATTRHSFSDTSVVGDHSGHGLFTVDGDQVKVARSLAGLSVGSVDVRIKVADHWAPDTTQDSSLERVLRIDLVSSRAITLTPASLAENAAAGTDVGDLAYSDPLAVGPYTFALVPGALDNDDFTLTGATLAAARSFDHEAQPVRTVRVRVFAGGPALFTADLEVRVTDVNEAPRGLDLQGGVVDENAAGAVAGTLEATDPDVGATLTYALVPGAGDTDNAAFEVVGDQLRTRGGLDFEAGATRAVRLAVSDGTLSQESSVVVTVRDRNDAPTAIDLASPGVRLDAEVGDVVGTLSATDADAVTAHAFSDLSVDGTHSGHGYFTVDGDQVKVARSLAGLTPSDLTLRVEVADPWAADRTQDATFADDLQVELLQARSITLSSSSVDENAAVGTVVGALTYTDPLFAGTPSFALPSGARDNAQFRLSASGELVTAVAFDHEATPTRSVRVRVVAGVMSYVEDLTVTITDVNEAPYVDEDRTVVAPIREDAALGTTVAHLELADPDGDAVTARMIADGEPGHRPDNESFAVTAAGVVTLTRALDHETADLVTYAVILTDEHGLSSVHEVRQSVADVNERLTAVRLSNASVLDSAADGTVVGTFSVEDPDAARPHVFAVAPGGDHAGLFEVVGDELRVAKPLVGVSGPKTVNLKVTDTWGAVTHDHRELVTITVSPDSTLGLSLSSDSVAENSPGATRVGDLGASGAGVAPHAYALVPGAADNDSFRIVDGTLEATRAFNFEATATRSVRVLVTDAGGHRWIRDVTVRVTDVNEPPIFLGMSNTLWDASTGQGVWPGGADPEWAPLTWSFATCAEGPDDNDRFRVSGSDFHYLGVLDYEEYPDGKLRICMGLSDGVNLVTSYRTFTIFDVNEPTTAITLDRNQVDVAAPVGSVVGTLTAVDPDSRKPVLSDVSVDGMHSGAGYFTVVDGELRVARDLSGLPVGPVTIMVRAADSWSTGGTPVPQSFTQVITLTVQRPLVLTADPARVDEGAAVGTALTTLAATGGTAPYTYALDGAGDDNSLVELDGDVLRTKAVLDHEDKASLTVRIKVTDDAGTVVRQTLTVSVTDVNEAPTGLDATGTLTENAPVGATARTLAAVDPDQGDQHTYTLVSGAGSGDNADFEIDDDRLVTKRSFDHEERDTLSVRVRVTDSGGLAFERQVNVAVVDVAEAPTAVTLSNASLDERRPAGTVVGTLTVTDPDAGERHTFAVPDGVPFEVVGNDLRTTAVLDFDDRASWTFDLVVTDKDRLTLTRSITVTVVDVTFDPIAVADSVTGIVGNTRTTGPSVLANDDDPEGGTLAATAGRLTTARGGAVTMAADGTFRYDPPAGLKDVTDTVDYEVTSSASGRKATGQISLEITSRLVWYADANAAASGDGTSHAPFTTLSLLGQGAASDKDKAGDDIFLADGTYGPIVLKQDQRLFGAQRGLPGLVSAAPAAVAKVRTQDSRPAVSLAANTEVDGVAIESFGNGSTGAALHAGNVAVATVTARSRIEGITGAAVSFAGGSGTLTVAAEVTGRRDDVVRVVNRPGAVHFTGLVQSLAANPSPRGVTLSNSTSVTFSGGLQLQTTGAALTASGGGSVTVTGSANWLRSSGAAALTVTGTSIGSGGINLVRADSAGTGPGISLVNTGAGRLVVSGEPGGTRSQVRGIRLEGTSGADLSAVEVLPMTGSTPSVDVDGLGGRLRLTRSSIAGATGNGIDVNGSTGELHLEQTSVTGAADSGVVVTSAAGVSTVTVSRSTISGSGATGGARDGVRVEASRTASVTTDVTGSVISDNLGDQVQVVARGSAASVATIADNLVTSSGQGIQVNAGGAGFTGSLAYDVRNNEVLRSGGVGIAVTTNGAGAGTLQGHVRLNTVGSTGGPCVTGILVDAQGAPVLVASVTGNTVRECLDPVVARGARDGSQLHLSVADNTVSGTGMRVLFGEVGSTGLTCLDASNHTGPLVVVARGGAVGLPGFSGPLTSSSLASWLESRTGVGVSADVPGSGVTLSALSCLTPTF